MTTRTRTHSGTSQLNIFLPSRSVLWRIIILRFTRALTANRSIIYNRLTWHTILKMALWCTVHTIIRTIHAFLSYFIFIFFFAPNDIKRKKKKPTIDDSINEQAFSSISKNHVYRVYVRSNRSKTEIMKNQKKKKKKKKIGNRKKRRWHDSFTGPLQAAASSLQQPFPAYLRQNFFEGHTHTHTLSLFRIL